MGSSAVETGNAISAAQGLAQSFKHVRAQSMELCSSLSAEDQMVQSMPDSSPSKWHLAHTTWFFETFILEPNLRGYQLFDPRFRTLFNSYYNAVGERPLRSQRGTFSRPSLAEVYAYRRHVDAAMNQLLGGSDQAINSLVVLGLNHEQQHQELIVTDIKHAFWTSPIRPAYHGMTHENSPQSKPGSAPPFTWHSYAAGLYGIGDESSAALDARSEEHFAFDNEGPRHQVYLQEFSLGSRLVTNREFMQFMADGGYTRPDLWLSDGWETALANRWSAPLYWEKQEGGWRYMTCGGMRAVDLEEPVCHVSFYEADAYARWAGARLATEPEWEAAAHDVPISGNLVESGNFHPVAAGKARSSDAGGFPQQMFGDVWEWTASPYVAYPGYAACEGALGEYNSKFMCNQMTLRGGSCVTPQSHIRATYRNFFPPQARWQFSGLRLARNGQ